MTVPKMIRKFALTLLVVASIGALPTIGHAQGRDGFREARGDLRGTLKSIDAKSVTIALPEGRELAAVEKTFPLTANVEIVTPLGGLGRGPLYKEIQRGDIPVGCPITLALSADQKKVECLVAEGPMLRGTVKTVDAKKRSVTLTTQPPGRDIANGEEQTLTVAADAEILLDDGRGRRFSVKEGQLDDVTQGAFVTARLSVDKKQAVSLQVEGAFLGGIIKNIDVQRKSLTLIVRPGRGDEAPEEKTLTVAGEAVILVDDGKGRRLSLKEAKLGDVPTGSMAQVKLSADQNFVMQLRVEGPVVMGMFKGADSDKGTITIAVPKGRDEPEEKTFTLAKDARIVVDGNETDLTKIKAVDNGPMIQLRLGLDQRTVQRVLAVQARRDQ